MNGEHRDTVRLSDKEAFARAVCDAGRLCRQQRCETWNCVLAILFFVQCIDCTIKVQKPTTGYSGVLNVGFL